MSARTRNIILGLIAVAVIALTGYFFKSLKAGQQGARIDLTTLLPERPDALLVVTRPADFHRRIARSAHFQNVLAAPIPEAWLKLLGRDDLNASDIHLVLSPTAPLLLIRTGTHMVEKIQDWALFGYPPERLADGPIHYAYFPDTEGLFMGCYQHEGLFVASYSRKLLQDVAKRQLQPSTRQSWDREPLSQALARQKTPYYWLFHTGETRWTAAELTQPLPASPDSAADRQLLDSLKRYDSFLK